MSDPSVVDGGDDDGPVAPLVCPQCHAPVALASATTVPCPRCGADVQISRAHHRLRDAHVLDDFDAHVQHLIGKPNGALELWGNVTMWFAGLLGGALAILSLIGSICYYLALCSGIIAVVALEVIGHALAKPLGVDLIDRYGGGKLYVMTAVVLMVFVFAPPLLVRWLNERALGRRRLAATMGILPPLDPNGPPLCRACHAGLEVSGAPLGVCCPYCRTDNLIGIVDVPAPGATRARTRKGNGKADDDDNDDDAPPKTFAAAGEAARRAGNLALRSLNRGLLGFAILLGFVYGVGQLGVFIDEEELPPTFAHSFGKPRALIADGKGMPDVPMGVTTSIAADAQPKWNRYFVALRRGENLVVRSRLLDAGSSLVISRTSSFPGIVWSNDTDFTRAPAGDSFVAWTAPYTGLFKLDLHLGAGWTERAFDLTWTIGPTPAAGTPPAPTLAMTTLAGHNKAVWVLAYDKAGRLTSASDDGSVIEWDGAAIAHRFERGEPVYDLAVDRDRRWLAVIGKSRAVAVLDATTGEVAADLRSTKTATSVRFTADSATLLIAIGATIELWPTPDFTGAKVYKDAEHTSLVVVDPTRARFFAMSNRRALAYTGTKARPVLAQEFASDVVAAAFAPDGKALVAVTKDQTVWQCATHDASLIGCAGVVDPAQPRDVAYSPDGKWFAAGGKHGVSLHGADSALAYTLHVTPESSVTAVTFSPTEHTLAAGLADGRIVVWTLPAPPAK